MSGLLEISIKDRVPGHGHQDTNGWLGPRTWKSMANQWLGAWISITGPRETNAGQDINGGKVSSYKAGSQEIKGSAWLGPRKSWLRSGNPERNV